MTKDYEPVPVAARTARAKRRGNQSADISFFCRDHRDRRDRPDFVDVLRSRFKIGAGTVGTTRGWIAKAAPARLSIDDNAASVRFRKISFSAALKLITTDFGRD